MLIRKKIGKNQYQDTFTEDELIVALFHNSFGRCHVATNRRLFVADNNGMLVPAAYFTETEPKDV